ncbi:uncharacterized protein YecT (DUF1311 family) [Erwinia toletana]|uniref:Uncharacterized protein YecT (DUF1311 family) n=1 Tax=Winslowiella toletana TaxID=92490 RepID=A0ABS4P7Z4_9GAMM|nr:lysozyme inhibitor LprI family protein [Winslowiella toletana]MBP2168771.1 uncharacterized protein YecT (DUF1311 family) [Winslowiella toletana]
MKNKLQFLMAAMFIIGLYSHGAKSAIKDTGLESKLWQVQKVKIYDYAQRRLYYQRNDDRLVGRFIQFSDNGITSGYPFFIDCQQPAYSISNQSVEDFIGKTVGAGNSASAEDYDLKDIADHNIKLIDVQCKTGYFAGGDGVPTSVAMISPTEILMNWADGTVLQLQAVQKENIKPSFNCEKASTPAEKTICSNYQLAAWDTSVNHSYQTTRKMAKEIGGNDILKQIEGSQKIWLKSRDTCTSDQQCLQQSMSDRLETLANILNEPTSVPY